MPRLPKRWKSVALLMAIGWPATVIALGLSITQQVWFFRTPLAQPMGVGFTWLLVFELFFAAAGMLCTSATLLGSKQRRAEYEGAYFPWGAVLPLAGIIFLLIGLYELLKISTKEYQERVFELRTPLAAAVNCVVLCAASNVPIITQIATSPA